MRPPVDKERVGCPVSGEKLKPESCWDSVRPNGERITYGIIPKDHKDRRSGGYVYDDCEWAGLPAPQPVEVL